MNYFQILWRNIVEGMLLFPVETISIAIGTYLLCAGIKVSVLVPLVWVVISMMRKCEIFELERKVRE
jgi:hypothetical protein